MWKDIPGFDGFYEASDDGLIRSKPRRLSHMVGDKEIYRNFSGRELKQQLGRDGLLYVLLSVNGHKTRKSVARLVASTWVEKDSDKHIWVTHVDGNYKNNCASNLKWLSQKHGSSEE